MAVTIRNLPPGREFVKKTDFIAVAQTPGSPLTSKIALSAAVDAVVAAGAGLEIVEGELRVTNTLSSYEVEGFTGSVSGANGKFKPQSTTLRNGKMTYKNDNGWVQFWDGEKWILSDIPFTTEPPASWIANGTEEKPGTFTFTPTGGSSDFAGQTGTNEVKSPPAVLTTELLSETGGLEIVDGKLQIEGTLPKTSVTGVTGTLSGSNGTFTPKTDKIQNGKPTYENENGWYQYWDKTLERWVMTDTPYSVASPAEWVANGTGETPGVFRPENGCSTGFQNQTIQVNETPSGIILTTEHIGPDSGLEFVDGKLRQIQIPTKIDVEGFSGPTAGANGTYEIQEVKQGGKATYKNENGWYKYWDETLGRWILTDTPYTTEEPASWIGGGSGEAPGDFTTETGTTVTGFTGTTSGANGNFAETGSTINGKPTFQNENGWVQYWDPTKNRWVMTDTPHTTDPPAQWIAGTNTELPGDFNHGRTGCVIGGMTGQGSGANGTFTPTGEEQNGKAVFKNENGWVQYWDPGTNRWVMTDTPYTTEAPAKWIGDGGGEQPGTFDSNNGGSTVTGFVGAVGGANGSFTTTGETENGKSTYSNGNGWYQYWDTGLNKWILTDKPYTTEGSNWIGNGSGEKPGTWDSNTGGGSPLFSGQSGGSSSIPGGSGEFTNQTSTTTQESGGSTEFDGQSSTTNQTGGGSADFGGNKNISGLTGAAAGANGWFNLTNHKENGKATYRNQNGWVQYWDSTLGKWVMTNTPYTTQPPAMWCGNGSGDTPGEFDESISGGSAEFQGQNASTTTSTPSTPTAGEAVGSVGSVTIQEAHTIPYYTGTSSPAVSSRADFVVTSAGHVGIGTTEPGHQLSITGDVSATGMIFADAFQSRDGNNTITFNDPVSVAGDIVADNLTGDVTGDVTGDLTGSIIGNLTLSGYQLNMYTSDNTVFPGVAEIVNRGPGADGFYFWPGGGTGDPLTKITSTGNIIAPEFHGTHVGSVSGTLTGDLTGNVTGNLTGDVDGHLTGSVAGNSVGSWGIAGNALNMYPDNTATTARRAEIVNRGQNNDDGEGFAFYVSGGAGDPPIVFDKAGEITAQAYHGDGSQLTGIQTDTDTIFEGDASVETVHTTTNGPKILFDIAASNLLTIQAGSVQASTKLSAKNSTDDSEANLIPTGGTPHFQLIREGNSTTDWKIKATGNGVVQTLETSINDAAKMVLDANGDLGIGSAIPDASVDVVRPAGTNADIRLASVNGSEARVAAGSSAAHVGTYSDHPLTFLTNTDEKMRIGSDGLVGIGTSDPQATLHVNGDILSDEITTGNMTVTNKLELSSGSKILVPDISPTGAGVTTPAVFPKYDGSGTWVLVDSFGGIGRSTDGGRSWKACKSAGLNGHTKDIFFARLSDGKTRWYLELNSAYPNRTGGSTYYGMYSDDLGDTWLPGHSLPQGYYRGDNNNHPTIEQGSSKDGTSTFIPSHRAYNYNYSHAAQNGASRQAYQNRNSGHNCTLPDIAANDAAGLIKRRQMKSWIIGGLVAIDNVTDGDNVFIHPNFALSGQIGTDIMRPAEGSKTGVSPIGGVDYSFTDDELDLIELVIPDWWATDTSGMIVGNTTYYGYNVSYNYDADMYFSYHGMWPAPNVSHGMNIYIQGLREIHRHKSAGGTIDQNYIDTRASAHNDKPFIVVHFGFTNTSGGQGGAGYETGDPAHGSSHRGTTRAGTRNIACDSLFTLDGVIFPRAAISANANLKTDFYERFIRYSQGTMEDYPSYVGISTAVDDVGGVDNPRFGDNKHLLQFYHDPAGGDKLRMMVKSGVDTRFTIMEIDGPACAAAINGNDQTALENSVTKILDTVNVAGVSTSIDYQTISNTTLKNRLNRAGLNDIEQVFCGSNGSAASRNLTRTEYDSELEIYSTSNANGMTAPSFYSAVYNAVDQSLHGKFVATYTLNSQPPRKLQATGEWGASNLPAIQSDYNFSAIMGPHKDSNDPLTFAWQVNTGSRNHLLWLRADGNGYYLTNWDNLHNGGVNSYTGQSSDQMNSGQGTMAIYRRWPDAGSFYGYSRGNLFVENTAGDMISFAHKNLFYNVYDTATSQQYVDVRKWPCTKNTFPREWNLSNSSADFENTTFMTGSLGGRRYSTHVYAWDINRKRSHSTTASGTFHDRTNHRVFYTIDTGRTRYDAGAGSNEWNGTAWSDATEVCKYPHFEYYQNIPFPATHSSRVCGQYYEGDTLCMVVDRFADGNGIYYDTTNVRWEVYLDYAASSQLVGTVQELGGTVTELTGAGASGRDNWRVELPIPRITNTLPATNNWNAKTSTPVLSRLDSHSGEYESKFWIRIVNVSDTTDVMQKQFTVRSGDIADWGDEPTREDFIMDPLGMVLPDGNFPSDLGGSTKITPSYTQTDASLFIQFPSGKVLVGEMGRVNNTEYDGPSDYVVVDQTEFDYPLDSRYSGGSNDNLKYRMHNRVGDWGTTRQVTINGATPAIYLNSLRKVFYGPNSMLTWLYTGSANTIDETKWVVTNDAGITWATLANPFNEPNGTTVFRYHASNGKLYIILGNGTVHYIDAHTLRTATPDANDHIDLNWTQVQISGLNKITDIQYLPELELYVALGAAGFYMSSTNGIDGWSSELVPQYAFATSLETGLYKDISHNLHLLNDGESKIEITQNAILLKDTTTIPKIQSPLRIEDEENESGQSEMYLGTTVKLTGSYDGGNGGELTIANWQNGVFEERLKIEDDGAVHISGVLSKSSGTFKIDHPLESKRDTHYLVHSFLEGPQADLIYRGQIKLKNGQGEADIDEEANMTEGTFAELCHNTQCFTNNETSFTPVKGSLNKNKLTITSEDPDSTDVVSWMVIAERRDEHMMKGNHTDAHGKLITEIEKHVEIVEETPPEPEEEEFDVENIQIFDESVDTDLTN